MEQFFQTELQSQEPNSLDRQAEDNTDLKNNSVSQNLELDPDAQKTSGSNNLDGEENSQLQKQTLPTRTKNQAEIVKPA